ncbi:MAG: YaaR family protein [Negativicutes bacterium]|nr:YaaR family protein [Negativicutes bacterium]
MKINNMRSTKTPPLGDRDVASKTEQSSGQFASDLLNSQDTLSKERLNMMLEQITEQGKKLGEAPTYSELKAYREMVRSFLGEAVGRAYALQSQTGWDRQGRQKMYSTIKEIDHHLAGLAEDVRQGQERQLDIMAKLDAIRGMLVDLYS